MILSINIESERYYSDQIKFIPKMHRLTYNDIELTINPMNQIISLKLDNKHPNCDESNYYCLGLSKFKLIDLETIQDLINRIKIWRLDDCYWIPDWIK